MPVTNFFFSFEMPGSAGREWTGQALQHPCQDFATLAFPFELTVTS
jgi:hypothetical protein